MTSISRKPTPLLYPFHEEFVFWMQWPFCQMRTYRAVTGVVRLMVCAASLVAAVSSTSAVPNSAFASEKSSLEDTSTLMRLNVFSAFSYPLRYRLMECISLGSPKSYCRYTSSQLAYPLFSALPFSSPAMILVMLLSVGSNPVSPSPIRCVLLVVGSLPVSMLPVVGSAATATAAAAETANAHVADMAVIRRNNCLMVSPSSSCYGYGLF